MDKQYSFRVSPLATSLLPPANENVSGRPINNIAQTFAHPQAIARKVVEEVEVRHLLPVNIYKVIDRITASSSW